MRLGALRGLAALSAIAALALWAPAQRPLDPPRIERPARPVDESVDFESREGYFSVSWGLSESAEVALENGEPKKGAEMALAEADAVQVLAD